MATRKNTKSETTTLEIVDAAERLVTLNGVLSLSARDVAKEAGCALGSIYFHFGNLDGLVLRVNSRFIARLDDRLAKVSRAERDSSLTVRFTALAKAYLAFAAQNRKSWNALFEHRMANGERMPDWHLKEHYEMFRHVEEPLRSLVPDMEASERMMLARTVYSSVHGIVSVNIESRLDSVPMPVLERQLEIFVAALVTGLEATLGVSPR